MPMRSMRKRYRSAAEKRLLRARPTAYATDMAESLHGKTALITGASKGLGKAIARALADAGATVALVSRDELKLYDTAKEIRAAGGRAEIFVADVTDEEQVARVRDKLAALLGPSIHILVNNAGINIHKPLVDFTLAEWRAVLDTNLTGVFLCCRAFIPFMQGRGYGRIINLTSMMSHISLPGRTAYSASKTALLGFTRSLALELAAEEITVNGISPGVFGTEMNIPLMSNPELSAQFLAKVPMNRW